jgi:hypothetical protein
MCKKILKLFEENLRPEEPAPAGGGRVSRPER